MTGFDPIVFRRSFDSAYREAVQNDPTISSRFPPDKAYEIFIYFFRAYCAKTGYEHPFLSKDNIRRLIEAMPVADDGGIGIELEPDDYPYLIDQYFRTEFTNCDYRINCSGRA